MEFPRALQDAIGFAGVREARSAPGFIRIEFDGRPEFTHSRGAVVQGGIVAAWLDYAIAAAVSLHDPHVAFASLDIKVSFLGRTGPGPSFAEGRVLKWGRSIAFLEAVLLSRTGELLATASSSGKLAHPKG
ncbi:MAG: PaaI family thioesterase [Burkholderiaceae bacterium]